MATITPSPSGQSGSVSYKINGADVTPPFTRGAGTYSIRAEDESGCIDVNQVDVYAPDNCTNPIATYLDYRVDVYDNASGLILEGIDYYNIYTWSLGGNTIGGTFNPNDEKATPIWRYAVYQPLAPASEVARIARLLTWALAPAAYAHYDAATDTLYVQHKPDYFGSGFGRLAFYFLPASQSGSVPPHTATAMQRFLVGEPDTNGVIDPRIANGYGVIVENGPKNTIMSSFQSQMELIWNDVNLLSQTASSATYELVASQAIAGDLGFASGDQPILVTNRGPLADQTIEIVNFIPSENKIIVRLNNIDNCKTVGVVDDGVNSGGVGSLTFTIVGEGGLSVVLPPSSTICPFEQVNCMTRTLHPLNCFPQDFNEQAVYDEAIQRALQAAPGEGESLMAIPPNPSSFRAVAGIQSWDANSRLDIGTDFGAWTAPYFLYAQNDSSYITINNVRFAQNACEGAFNQNDLAGINPSRLSRLYNYTHLAYLGETIASNWPAPFSLVPAITGCNDAPDKPLHVSQYPRVAWDVIDFSLSLNKEGYGFASNSPFYESPAIAFPNNLVAGGDGNNCSPLYFPPVQQLYTALNQGFIWQNGPQGTTGSGDGSEPAQTMPTFLMAVDLRYTYQNFRACTLPTSNPNYPLCDNEISWAGVGVCGINLTTQERLWVRTENLFAPTRDCQKCSSGDPMADVKGDVGCEWYQDLLVFS